MTGLPTILDETSKVRNWSIADASKPPAWGVFEAADSSFGDSRFGYWHDSSADHTASS